MPVEVRGSILTFRKRATNVIRPLAHQITLRIANKIITFARQRWPVAPDRPSRKGGKSRAALRYAAPEVGVVVLYADAEERGTVYSPLIQSKGVRPWEAYIVKPSEQAIRDIPNLIGKALEEAWRVK